MKRDSVLSALFGGMALGLCAYHWLIWSLNAFTVAVVGLAFAGAAFAYRAQHPQRGDRPKPRGNYPL